jgi:predicted phage tail protein
MVTIRLLGEIGRLFGRSFKIAVKTPAEALRALCVQIPELRQYLMCSADKGINWRVVTEDPMGLDEEQLQWPLSTRMILAPQPAGRGAVGRIVAGVALVVAGIFTGGATFAFLGSTLGGFVASALTPIGLSLTLGGVAQLLTPTPVLPTVRGGGGGGGPVEGRSEVEQLKSFIFDKSNANTAQGEVVPVLYGERLIGALPVISFGLELQNSL